jgi:hypothetical protein
LKIFNDPRLQEIRHTVPVPRPAQPGFLRLVADAGNLDKNTGDFDSQQYHKRSCLGPGIDEVTVEALQIAEKVRVNGTGEFPRLLCLQGIANPGDDLAKVAHDIVGVVVFFLSQLE